MTFYQILSKKDVLTRMIFLALFYSGFWILAHWLITKPAYEMVWIAPQLFSSLLIYFCINGLFLTFEFYNRKWPQFLVSFFYLQPLFQISYFQTYKGFMEQQNISLILREPGFLINVLMKEISLWQVLAFIALWFGTYKLNKLFLSSPNLALRDQKPYDLFKSKVTWILLALAIASQIKWCLKHDTSLLAMRPIYPIVAFALISVLWFLIRTRAAWISKAFVLSLISLNIGQLYGFSLGYADVREKLSLDSQYYRSLFGAYFVHSALSSLDQNDKAFAKYQALPIADIDYNILLIQDDSQRWDFSNRHGYGPEETDRVLNWFYDRSFDFQYPLSSANNTDTSVPATLTGKGSDKDVLSIKDNLVIWDYFAKKAETFFVSSQILNWAKLDLFYKSVGMKRTWTAAYQSEYKGLPENIDDTYIVKEWKRYVSEELKSPWVGVLQTYASHYPYAAPEGQRPYGPCDLTRKSGPQQFKNCYLNGQYHSAHAKDEILKATDLDNTVVVLFSDHGEGIFEHGVWLHTFDYHQEMIKVPLVIHIPERLKKRIPPQNLKNFEANQKKVVSTLDITPTLLHLHELLTGQKLESDLSIFSGKSLFTHWDYRVVFSSHCFPQYRCYSREIAFVDEDYYVIYRPSEGFFKIYSTWGDLKQETPLDPRKIPTDKLERLVEEAARMHAIGKNMKAYFDFWKTEPEKNP